MDQNTRQSSATALYPAIDPFDQRTLDVGDGHTVYVEQCGNPDGLPAVVLHGGPGGGCSPLMRRFFDPAIWRVVLFDQRGCGRSRPHAAVAHNTTWDLVADVERIRTALGIDAWAVFGGSWGATLALIYAITHPDRAAHLILRGIFLMTQRELDWFYGGGAGQFWPEVWRRFVDHLPEDERDDVIAGFNRRLFSGNHAEETRFARAWASWENTLASIENDGPGGDSPAEYARAFARLENHYFMNSGFLDRDGWILANIGRLENTPAHIVQGRYDMICPPISAMRLHDAWPLSRMSMISKAGHALSEPGISGGLVRISDTLRDDLAKATG